MRTRNLSLAFALAVFGAIVIAHVTGPGTARAGSCSDYEFDESWFAYTRSAAIEKVESLLREDCGGECCRYRGPDCACVFEDYICECSKSGWAYEGDGGACW